MVILVKVDKELSFKKEKDIKECRHINDKVVTDGMFLITCLLESELTTIRFLSKEKTVI